MHKSIKSLLLLAACLQVSSAFAGEIGLDFRFDYLSSTYNDDMKAASASNTSNSRFYVQTGRVDYKGKLGEDLSFRLRLRFDKDFTSTNYRSSDKVSNWVDYAYVTHQITDNFSLTFGKLYGGVAGVAALLSSADIYAYNKAYSYAVANGYFFSTGAKATYKFDGQEFSLIGFNNPKDVDTSVTPNTAVVHSRIGAGLYYHGSFADGMIEPVVSYHSANYNMQSGQDKDRKDTLATIGTVVKAGGVEANIDYNSYTYAKKNSLTEDDTLKSLYLAVSYPVENWKPKLTYENSEDTVTSATTTTKTKTTYTNVSAALEYKPKMDQNFRYHLVYNVLSSKADTTNAPTLTENQVIAGIRFVGDFLK